MNPRMHELREMERISREERSIPDEIPLIRIELEQMKLSLRHALVSHAEEFSQMAQRAVDEFCTPERLQKIINAQAEAVIKKARLMRRRCAVRLSLPASLLRGHRGVEHVTLTGIHATTRSVLYRSVRTGRAGELSRWRDDDVARRLTAKEAAEYVRLVKANADSERSLERFTSRVQIEDVEKFVAAEVEKVAGTEEEH